MLEVFRMDASIMRKKNKYYDVHYVAIKEKKTGGSKPW